MRGFPLVGVHLAPDEPQAFRSALSRQTEAGRGAFLWVSWSGEVSALLMTHSTVGFSMCVSANMLVCAFLCECVFVYMC